MSDAPTLLRDLIDIPERVQTNDFVLKLSEGVTDAGGRRDHRATTWSRRSSPTRSTTRSASSRARWRAAAARPATCTARSAPAKATSWPC